MKAIVSLLFGPSWKTSLVSLAGALIVAGTAYAQSRPEPGWYIVAFLLAALGRLAKDADKTNAPTPVAESQKV